MLNFNAIYEVICISDDEGTLIYANTAYETGLHVAKEKAPGES
ncbi:hypothetical protein [Desulfosediminicola ganghwensis]|nr:hypothetical protein [Desulfosediminicola ganghwensis]